MPTMALGVSATMVFLLLYSLVIISHCDALQADSATTNASSSYKATIIHDKVHAVEDVKGLVHLSSNVGKPDSDQSLPEPAAEPDPDRSLVDLESDVDSDQSLVEPIAESGQPLSKPLPNKMPGSATQPPGGNMPGRAIQPPGGKAKRKEKANRKRDGKKKTKKHHDGDAKGNKEKAKNHHRQSDDEEDAQERIHWDYRTEDKSVNKKNNLSHNIKSSDNGDNSEDESVNKKNNLSHNIKNSDNGDNSNDNPGEELEKKAKRWRKAIKSRFGHGRRFGREEAMK